MQRDTDSERVGSKCYMDWSWWKARWCPKYYCGTFTDLWECDQPIPDTALPAVIRGRKLHLQGCNQWPNTGHMHSKISFQTTDSDKYVSYTYTHYSHPWFYTLHLREYYTGQALFQLKFGSVHHFSSVIFQVSGLYAWSTQVDAATISNTGSQCNHRINATMLYMCYQGDHRTFHSYPTTRLNVALGFLLLFARTLDLKIWAVGVSASDNLLPVHPDLTHLFLCREGISNIKGTYLCSDVRRPKWHHTNYPHSLHTYPITIDA